MQTGGNAAQQPSGNSYGQHGNYQQPVSPDADEQLQTNSYNNPQGIKVIERIVEVEKDDDDEGGIHIPNPFLPIKWLFQGINGCRQLVVTGCFLIVVFIVALVLTVIFRPPFLWNPLKAFLNDDFNPPPPAEASADEVYAGISDQADEGLTASISEQQLSVLLSERIQQGKEVRVDMEDKLMRILVNIDTSDSPLWLALDIVQEDDKLAITRIGFGRLSLPEGVNSFLSDQIFAVLQLTKQQIAGSTTVKFTDLLIDQNKIEGGVSISAIAFAPDELQISFNSN